MEQITKRIIWIDKNVETKENQIFLEILKSGIKGALFYPVKSIKEAFELIKNRKEIIYLKNKDKKEAKVFQFRLFYVIISGSLSNEFFYEYVKATKELTIISANIIFCCDEAKHKTNAYYLDDFLNPGKVFNEKSFDKIIDYINRDECQFLNYSYLLENKKEYIPKEKSFGSVFLNANSISDIVYPFFFGQIINSSFISEYELESFQSFLLIYYPELKDLIFPSREKKITIPYYLLSKFYLHMYTYEKCNFFKNMNFDLSNDKFDLYRVYIFLLYDALNKKAINSFYTGSLFRGSVLSKKEFKGIENAFKNKEYIDEINNNIQKKDEINICLYFSKMFLSFSKNKNIAKGFLHEGNEELIPVLFEVEKINEKDIKNIKNNNKDFFISNLDLKNITEYEEEEEVLFLPFSCFEIVSIKDEIIKLFGKDINIKKITLNYLHKYRNSLYKYISEIKEKEKFENFLKQVINSGFSSEIAQLINFDMDKEFRNFINQKLQFKKNFLNFKPIQNFKFMSSQLYAQTAFNKLFPEAPKSIQKILVEGKEALLVILEDGLNILLTYSENKVFYRRVKEIKDYITVKKLDLNSINNGEIAHKALKTCNECNVSKNDNFCDNCIKKVEHRNQKGNIEQSNYFEFFSVGLVIGDFIANYESIKDEPLITQLKSLSGAAISCLAPFLPKIFSTFLPKAIVSKVPILMASISSIEFIISLKEIKSDKSLSKSETNSLIFKKVLSFIGEIGISILVGKIGFKILLFLNVGPGIIVGVAAIGIGIATGYAISKIKNKFEDSKNLSLFSDSLYYQYIPKKFREYCIPTLCWNGVKNAQSFAIELVEDGIRKWLVINIKKWIRKIDNENYFDVGDTIVEYSGISKHPFKVTFILYELKKEKFKPEEWGVGENIKEDYSEELSKYFIQVAVLDVF